MLCFFYNKTSLEEKIMALIYCKDCGRAVSDQAMSCPGCGRNVQVLKDQGYACRNCKRGHEYRGDCDRTYGLPGYPCLAYVKDEDCFW